MTRLVRFSNNAVSRLAANITNASTTISLTPGDGAKFPVISGTQFFMATLIKSTGETEIVKVTARATDTLTVVRAAEPVGATQVAYAFSAGDRIEQRLTAKALSDELDRLDSGANIGATNKTANYTVQAADVSTLIRVDTTAGAITITLPEIASLADDFDIMVAKVTDNANAVNIVRSGSTDLINGATSYPVNNQWQSAWLIADRSTNTWTAINSGAATSSIAVDTFTGDGTAGPYTLSGDPMSKANTAVYLSGVYQQKATYTLSGTSLTMGGNVPVGVTVEVVWSQPLSIGRTDAGMVSYDGGTVQDVLDAMTGPNGAGSVGYMPAGTGAVATTVQRKLQEFVSVFDFMTAAQIADVQAGTALVDVTSAIQNALNSGKAIYAPEGTYRVTSTLFLKDGTTFIGAGRQKTIIKSDVIGASLFSTNTDPVAFVYMADMKLQGNNLTGASGNGHAINLIDPVSGGAFSPQACIFERLWIRGFRGIDNADRDGVKKISAAGVCMYGPLAIVLRDILCAYVGHGFYAHQSQNSRIEDCITDQVDKFSVFAYDNEQLTVVGCDLINSSDGVVDSGYPEPGLPTGIIGSFKNEAFVFRQNKVKGNKAGKAAIVIYESIGDVIDANWIRGDAQTDVPHKAIFADKAPALKITNNTFSPSQTAFMATRPYETIELYNTLTTRAMTAEITNNYFIDTQIHETAYNIKINGDAAVRTFLVNIRGNMFGRSGANPQTTTIQKDIYIDTCTFQNSVISGNTFNASTNVTRTACIFAGTATLSSNTIGPNRFEANGGTLTTEYSGVFPSVLNAEVAYDAPSLADGAGVTTTVTVTGAQLGDFAEASMSSGNLGGILLTAWVSATNTVSVRLQNETGGTIDLNNQSLRVRVRGRLSF